MMFTAPFALGGYGTLVIAVFVLLVGRFLTANISFLKKYHIPEAVAGGFLFAIVIWLTYSLLGLQFTFDDNLRVSFMLAFFATVGLAADFSLLKKGGKSLVLFLIVTSVMIALQNTIGTGLAFLLGESPFIGLIAGSVTLTGGHGTGAAWGDTFANEYNIIAAKELAIACATFGLVAGGLLGGPVAKHLMKKVTPPGAEHNADDLPHGFELPDQPRKMNAESAIQTTAMIAVCLWLGTTVDEIVKNSQLFTSVTVPTFVWVLLTGVILRNVMQYIFKYKISSESIDVLGNASLALFLAIALVSLKLWQLASMAIPVLIILSVQVAVMATYAIYITFPAMGKDYDAVVMSAAHCGFGLGATPTAVANMQTVTQHFGPSHKAFLVVPMVAGFFIDLSNASILQFFVSMLS
jgi:ESS family glutamate:Na+ symporter